MGNGRPPCGRGWIADCSGQSAAHAALDSRDQMADTRSLIHHQTKLGGMPQELGISAGGIKDDCADSTGSQQLRGHLYSVAIGQIDVRDQTVEPSIDPQRHPDIGHGIGLVRELAHYHRYQLSQRRIVFEDQNRCQRTLLYTFCPASHP